jgi:hypothetical protein
MTQLCRHVSLAPSRRLLPHRAVLCPLPPVFPGPSYTQGNDMALTPYLQIPLNSSHETNLHKPNTTYLQPIYTYSNKPNTTLKLPWYQQARPPHNPYSQYIAHYPTAGR